MRREIQSAAALLSKVLALPRRPRRSPLGTVKETTATATVPKKQKLKAHEVTEQYWLDPSSPLWAFLQRHGIQTEPGHIPPFAQGGVGRVYFVGPYAVKFSANRVEANVAQMVRGRTDLPTAVIDVEYLGNNLYVILQPYVDMDNVPEEIRKAADYLTAVIDAHPEMQGFPTNRAAQERLCRQALEDNGGDPSLLPHMVTLMGLMGGLYQATGFHHNDAGPSNVGMYQNRVVVPDLGPNEDDDYNPLAALGQINKNRETLGLPRHRSF